jgi:hypothetical protein
MYLLHIVEDPASESKDVKIGQWLHSTFAFYTYCRLIGIPYYIHMKDSPLKHCFNPEQIPVQVNTNDCLIVNMSNIKEFFQLLNEQKFNNTAIIIKSACYEFMDSSIVTISRHYYIKYLNILPVVTNRVLEFMNTNKHHNSIFNENSFVTVFINNSEDVAIRPYLDNISKILHNTFNFIGPSVNILVLSNDTDIIKIAESFEQLYMDNKIITLQHYKKRKQFNTNVYNQLLLVDILAEFVIIGMSAAVLSITDDYCNAEVAKKLTQQQTESVTFKVKTHELVSEFPYITALLFNKPFYQYINTDFVLFT